MLTTNRKNRRRAMSTDRSKTRFVRTDSAAPSGRRQQKLAEFAVFPRRLWRLRRSLRTGEQQQEEEYVG